MRRPTPHRPDPLLALWDKRAGGDTLADAVYATLRAAILTGVLGERAPLREDRLARSLSVSRTPVREALKALSREGLLAPANGKGVAVVPMDARDLEELYEIRGALEPAAARLAAHRASPAELRAMRAVLGEMERHLAAPAADVARLAALSARFTDLVAEAARNRRLARLIRQHREIILRAEGSTLGQAGRAPRALAAHRRLLRALEARDPDGAARACLGRLEEARRIRLQLHLERTHP
jgi:DNA-binding GntR family transcriptional regulator